MKFKLKMIAIAAAMASLAGGAQADIAVANSGNSSITLLAFNTATRAWYIRDTGFLMNDFLPSSVTTLSGDGGLTGNKTPEAGLLLNAANTANFGDASFSTWLTGQNAADIRWMVSAADSLGTSATSNVKRVISSSADAAQTATNGQIDGYVGTGNAGRLTDWTGSFGLSTSGSDVSTQWDINFGLAAPSLALLDQSVGLFYFARSTGTGSTTTLANGGRYGNSAGFATVTLASNGDLTYSLAAAEVAAVPVPAAAWLLGSGLMGLGGFVRRRKAAALA